MASSPSRRKSDALRCRHLLGTQTGSIRRPGNLR
jgi:hypothetical protein